MPFWSLVPQGVAPQQIVPRFERAAPLANLPAVMIDRKVTGLSLAPQLAKNLGLQARILWIDGTANLDRVSSDDKIFALVQKVKASGFNTIIFDVKPISGQTLYKSEFAPKIESWREQKLPLDFDPLESMTRHAKSLGLSIFASVNAFSEGHTLFKVGPGYDKKDWQSVIYQPGREAKSPSGAGFPIELRSSGAPTENELSLFSESAKLPKGEGLFTLVFDASKKALDGYEDGGMAPRIPSIPAGGFALVGTGAGARFLRENFEPGKIVELANAPRYVPISEVSNPQIPLMMNPNKPEVQAYELAIAREIVARYPVDGLVYDDRFRYAGLDADFSPESKRLFEASIGRSIHWPDDVYRFTTASSGARGLVPGPLFDAWLGWRARILREFLLKARQAVKGVRPNAQLGIYSGGNYADYPSRGANWGSPDLEAGYWFLSDGYKRGGLAPDLDFFMPGCYYSNPTIFDALGESEPIGQTIEAAASTAGRVIGDETWTYAGIAVSPYQNHPAAFQKALQTACATSEGVMVFDLSYLGDAEWDALSKAFQSPKLAPHQSAGALLRLRAAHAATAKKGVKTPPIVILSGASGVGN